MGKHGETKKLGTSVTGEPWWSWWNADSRGSFWSMCQKHILFTISREFVGTRFVQKKYATAQRPRRLQNTKGKNWPSWTKYIKIQHVVQFGTELYWTIPFSALTPFLMHASFRGAIFDDFQAWVLRSWSTNRDSPFLRAKELASCHLRFSSYFRRANMHLVLWCLMWII